MTTASAAANIAPATEPELREKAWREYTDRGYRVVEAPGAGDLPSFLAPFRPSLVATTEGESVVVEVRRHADLRDANLHELARAVAREPGWRLDLIVADETRSPWDGEPAHPVAPEAVDGFFALAEEALSRGQTEAATVLVWTGAEASLRLLARARGVDLDDLSPSLLVRQLYSEGWLERRQRQTLMDLLESRNLTVHGLRPASTVGAASVRSALQVAREVWAASAAQERK